MKTHFEVLGCFKDEPLPAIRGKYLALARKLHPDRCGGTAEANEKFAEVTRAYAVLSDHERRRLYEIELKIATEVCPFCSGAGSRRRNPSKPPVLCSNCEGSGRIPRPKAHFEGR